MQARCILVAAALVAASLLRDTNASATDGTWTNATSNSTWSTVGNWSGGTVAGGIDGTANFSTLDLTVARTVNLGANITIGNLTFGDADTSTAFNWTLANGTGGPWALTLQTSTGQPTINIVNQTTTISAALAGTQGFAKTGAGTLTLSGNNSALTGGITLSAGVLNFAANSLGTNTVDITAAATLGWSAGNTQDVSAQIKIEDGVSATINTGANNVTLATALQTGPLGTGGITKIGTGTLTITAANTYTGATKVNVGRVVLSGGDNRLAPTGTITLGQGANNGILQLGDASSASNQTTTSLTIVGTGTTNAVVGGNTSVSTLTINNSAAITYAGLLGGAGTFDNNLALAKTGAGNLTISNASNTFTGGVTINQGTLSFASGALGSTGLITFAATSSLQWATGNTQDVSARIKISDGVIATISTNGNNVTLATPFQTGPLGTGGLTKGDDGNLTITGANTYTGTTRVNNGRMILTGGDNRLSTSTPLQLGNSTNSGTLQLGDASGSSNQTVTGLTITGTGTANAVVGGAAANSIFTINNAANITGANSPIFGGTGTNENNLTLVKTGAGSLSLAKTSTFTGDVNLLGGALIVTNNASLGAGPKTVTVSGTTNAPSLQLNSTAGIVLAANISLVTSNDNATAPAIVNTTGQNLIGGAITLADSGFGGGQTRILVNGGALTLSGAIAASTSAATDRTLILDGAANGSVTGTISDGAANRVALDKEGTGTWSLTAANSYTGSTTVNGGRLNITTAQTGTGAITVADGATLGVSLTGAGQTLTPSALTLNHATGGSALSFDLGNLSNPAVPLITTITFITAGAGSNIIDIAGTGLSVGTFDLIDYSGAIGGSGFGGLALGTLPARVTAVLVDGTGKVQLSITAFDVPKWTGATNGDWDVNDDPNPAVGAGTVNWKEATSGQATRYLQIGSSVDSVIFDDTATGTTVVNLTTSLSPTSATINNSVLNYTFTGFGKLTGATNVLKTGTEVLIFANTGGNDYTGLTTINGGTLQIGDGVTQDAGQLGSGGVSIGAGGTLAFDRPAGVGQDLAVSNVISGTGALTQQGGNTVTVSGNNSAFDGAVNILSGTLKVGSANALGSAVGGTNVSAGAVLDVTGFSLAEPITLNGGTLKSLSGTSTLGGAFALAGGGIIDAVAGTLTISAAITGSGGLTKIDAGGLVLTNTNTFAGGLTVNGGTVTLSANQSYTGGTTIGDGGTLQIGASAASTTGNPGSGDIALNATTGVATLNILRSDAFEIAGNITSTGANATNTITIGATGATSASGTVTFSGTNTFTGNITINGGALRITNSSALGVGPKVVKVGSNAGPALKLDGTSGNITLATGIDFQISSDGTIASAAANPGAIVNVAGDNVINGRISLVNGGGGNGRLTVQAGSLTVNGNIDADTATGVRTLLLGGVGNGTINGIVSDFNSTATTAVSLTKDGTGTWTLNGANSFSGAVSVQDGTLQIASIAGTGSAQALGTASSAITIGTASTTGTLEYAGATDATLNRPITVNGAGGAILKNSGGALLTLGGTITRASRPLTFTGGAFNVTGQITGASSTLTVNGATVTLSQTTNNYVGNTVVQSGGVLKNGASGTLPDTTTVVLGGASGNTGGSYDLNGFDEAITGLTDAGTGSRIVTNGAASGTAKLTVTGTSIFNGSIQDGATAAVALTKSTAGTLTLTGANTYSGATTVAAGSLLVAGAISGTTSVAVNGGTLGGNGTITTENNGSVTVASGASVAPGLSAPGTLTLALGAGQLDASAAAGGTGWLKFELGTSSDRVLLTSGTLNLGTGLDLDDFSFTNAGGFGIGTYVLFDTNNTITPNIGTNTTGTVLGFTASLQLSTDGTDLVLNVVPEPNAGWSLLGGLGSLLGLQRFRRRSRRALR